MTFSLTKPLSLAYRNYVKQEEAVGAGLRVEESWVDTRRKKAEA